MTAAVPAVEIANHRNAAGIRRPYREPYTRYTIYDHLMRTETSSEITVLAFGEQIYVKLAQ